jgi:hypothetical protein
MAKTPDDVKAKCHGGNANMRAVRCEQYVFLADVGQAQAPIARTQWRVFQIRFINDSARAQ